MLCSVRGAITSGLFVAALIAGCGGDGAAEPTPGPREVDFPDGFLWGSATAGFQIERGLSGTDWGVWAGEPGHIAGGDDPDDGPDALAHVAGDIALMQQAGLNSYRFSIEMARVYPDRASFDADAADAAGLGRYDALVDALGAAAIAPMVTLHHFVWPAYLSDPTDPSAPQGFERADAVEVFASWCGRMAGHFGDRVDLWVTINEPVVEATVGYLSTVFPPGVSEVERVVAVMRRQVEANARCYDAIHQADQVDADGDGAAALVSIAKHDRVYEPRDKHDARDVAAAEHARHFWNQWFTDAVVLGDIDDDFDDQVDVLGDQSLGGRADYFGLNYYGVSLVDADTLRLPYLGNVPSQTDLPTERPKSDLGWDIAPEGFAVVLDEAARYGLPIYVTENGIADATDQNRSRYLAEHLFELGKARLRAVDVRGYYHWSLIDNFEWASGFCPRFGLFAVDFAAADKTRSATAAVPLLRSIALDRVLTAERVAALPPYVSAPVHCTSY